MKTIAFAGSNSSVSINHQLVTYITSLVDNSEVIKLTDYDIPMYGIDSEENQGIPKAIKTLDTKLSEAQNIIISVAEHNGNITAFLKSILDWLSRNNRNFLENKKVILLSTSPGGGGGASALAIAEKTIPYFGGKVVTTLSIGSFYDNFKEGKIINQEMKNSMDKAVQTIK
ncbi:MAG: NAD(P)H-dependent oxidoreductase [Flavobacteriaceae bacterium]|nr:NAD(P)H-dependent oxidoreductase [Flavobacteriaceae bacterium]